MTESAKSATSEPQNAPPDNMNMEDRIRCRAYEIFEARGGDPGRDVQDWLEAEQEFQAMAKSA